jgi:hypothetical protein
MNNMRRRKPHGSVGRFRQGFTLIELISNMLAMTLLIVGMASSIKLASLSAPQATNPVSAALSATDALELLTNDLRYALTINELTSTRVSLTLPDRDGQAPATETIVYTWSGTQGDDLVRTFNGVSTVIAADVREFSLVKHTRTVAVPTTFTESPEVRLTFYSTSSATTDWPVATKNWIGEYFLPILPLATSWKPTRVVFNAKQNGTGPGATNGVSLVEVRSATTAGLPTNTVLATQTLLESSLSTTYTQQSFTLTGVPDQPVGTGLCLVVKFSANTPSCSVQYLNSGAISITNKFVTTTNSGSSWSVGSGKSMLFEVWGTYKIQDFPAYQYFLRDIRCALRTGTSTMGRVEKSVRVLNEPQVASP